MSASGWKQLLEGAPWFRGPGKYPISAYSEFVPPPREVRKAYQEEVNGIDEADFHGWPISEWEEADQLRPGLLHVGQVVVRALADLAHGKPVRGFSRNKLAGNAAWPPLLFEKGLLAHERYLTLLPLALSKTQDDKGRVRWTLFGSSEQGPARPFWRSFFTTPRRQAPAELGESFFRQLLHAVYGIPLAELADLHKAGFRILPLGKYRPWPHWREEPLPDWANRYLLTKTQALRGVRFLLTFRLFATLPDNIQQAYLEGQLHLLPCPGSLLFWGVPSNLRLQHELPLAAQVPLLHLLPRREAVEGLRIPQTGWLHEPRPGDPELDDAQLAVKNTYLRTHKMGRLHRHEDELAKPTEHEAPLAKVLFSTAEGDLGLYGKPMARNVQLWNREHQLLLDGPRATREAILRANQTVDAGGLFGYRFVFPAMRVGEHEVYWHRPLVAYQDFNSHEPVVWTEELLGYLTAYRPDRPDLGRPIELWPRPLHREPYLEALNLFQHLRAPKSHQTRLNALMLLDAFQLRGERPLPRTFARQILLGDSEHSLESWLADLPERSADSVRGKRLVEELERCLEPPGPLEEAAPEGRTFSFTARRSFEVAYWKNIAYLSEGEFRTKCNADCVLDEPTQKRLKHKNRDLDPLGDYLLSYYRRLIARAGRGGVRRPAPSAGAVVGELPFYWKTDFDYSWMGGWLKNQRRLLHERDLVVVIPGRDRRRAVIMADHYDTAYMLDCYDPHYGGTGARLAASGADDNYSATVALMEGARVFLDLSRRGELGCDVWLVHLTGEEFPADCLGARHLSQVLVEGGMRIRLESGHWHDLSKVRVQGVYVLDMVAHNNDKEPDVFQIAPGTGRESLWLAEQAHRANEAWNAACLHWNQRGNRRGLGRGRRSEEPDKVPDMAAHLPVRGEVRLPVNPRSTLYNTDGQIFSDAGIPVVLFMENYDIDRTGYHDTHDTMANIDLDYGSAVAAIAIESVARAATETPPHS
jgi:hypothetical protein